MLISLASANAKEGDSKGSHAFLFSFPPSNCGCFMMRQGREIRGTSVKDGLQRQKKKISQIKMEKRKKGKKEKREKGKKENQNGNQACELA